MQTSSIGKPQILSALSKVPGISAVQEKTPGDILSLSAVNDNEQLWLQTLLRPTIAGDQIDVKTRNFVILRQPATQQNLLGSLQHFPGVTEATAAPFPFSPTAHPAFIVKVATPEAQAVLQSILKDQIPVTDDGFQPLPTPWDVHYQVVSGS